MILHNDQDAFRVLLETIHNETGYRKDVLEKDYYVVLLLKELSELQRDGLPAYFKGGTALYKALKTTNRFSEDIYLLIQEIAPVQKVISCLKRLPRSMYRWNVMRARE